MGKVSSGYIEFLAEGRMTVLITAEGSKAPGTDDDRAAPYDTAVAFTGGFGDEVISSSPSIWPDSLSPGSGGGAPFPNGLSYEDGTTS